MFNYPSLNARIDNMGDKQMNQTQFREAINALYKLAKHQETINGVDWETNLVSIVKVTVESERAEQGKDNDVSNK